MSDDHRYTRCLLAIVTAALLASCGGGGGADPANPSPASQASAPRPVAQTDLQIATQIYSGDRTPTDFFVEPASNGSDLVARMHLKNSSLDPSLANTPGEYELCTDDWNQALGWSETSAQQVQPYADLVATNDDARFFEFERVRSGTPELQLEVRVFKCAYLDRTDADLRGSVGAAGQLNVRPIDADELKGLSEYLWQFTTYNNFGHAVLKSSTSAADPLEHTLYLASLARAGTSADCDRIDVIAWRHSVESTTGVVTRNVQALWSFGARELSGVAQLCSA